MSDHMLKAKDSSASRFFSESSTDQFDLLDFESYLAKMSNTNKGTLHSPNRTRSNPFFDIDPFECEDPFNVESNQFDPINLFPGKYFSY
jgi:hypothetical protein